MYTILRLRGITQGILKEDGSQIPIDVNNSDFREFLLWNAVQEIPLTLEESYDLIDHRSIRIEEIDSKTKKLISNGFTFNAEIFSLSAEAQMNWTNLFQFRAGFSYPKKVSTKDHGEYSLIDIAMVVAFCQAALNAVNGHLDSGRALKKQIRLATSKSEIDAIIDDR